jgi:hypothetical protein
MVLHTYVCWLCSRFAKNRSSWSWSMNPLPEVVLSQAHAPPLHLHHCDSSHHTTGSRPGAFRQPSRTPLDLHTIECHHRPRPMRDGAWQPPTQTPPGGTDNRPHPKWGERELDHRATTKSVASPRPSRRGVGEQPPLDGTLLEKWFIVTPMIHY